MRNHRFLRQHWIPLFALLAFLAVFFVWIAPGGRSAADYAFAGAAGLGIGIVCLGFYRQERTVRQAAEEQERRLRRKDEAFLSLFGSAPVSISLIDRTGAFLRANPATGHMVGRSGADIAGKSFAEFVHANHIGETMRRFGKALEGEAQTFQTVLLLHDGHPADVQVTALPVRDGGDTVTGLIAICEDMTKKRRSEERIKQMAYYDDLTGLPNRRLFRDLIADDLRSSSDRSNVCVLLLNVDRFKVVNSSLGQDIGDMLLLQLADRLHRCVTDVGVAARMEGDEFGVLFRDGGGTALLGDLVRRINQELEEPFVIQEYTLHITTSMGIAAGRLGDDESQLLKNAGIALSKAKEKGKNGCEQYTPEMDEQYVSKFTLENDMRKAIHDGEFLLLYQPQVHIFTGEIVGMEALIRWRHPERGLIFPGEFIPLAEETGLIVPLSEWVFREACLQCRAWQREGLPRIPVSVNLSVRQFLQPNLTERVAAILSETGMEPSLLELEITESMTMDVEFATEALLRLKRLGLRISIDDFGTGYSSLNYLKNFPVDKLKIDRSFVSDIMDDPNDAAIVRTIITMAHHLNQTVIAEGVETEEQLAYLRTYGCDEMQGYLFSPPLAADRMRERLAESREGSERTGA